MGRLGQVVEGGGKSLLFAIGNYVNIGQPLGYHGSWPTFALSHHILVWCVAKQVHPGVRFTSYAVLGDDVVIADQEVAKVYESALGGLGGSLLFPSVSSTYSMREAGKSAFPDSMVELRRSSFLWSGFGGGRVQKVRDPILSRALGVTYLSALVSAAVVLWQGLDHLATYAFACLSADAYSFPHAFAGWLS
ncbi:unnamed protein product [Arabidopsis arenosa]|uniref:Uncharacterized protein n=1 Tax=Arabidopsis arenosa TaxID=38785 RepID=A0A8S2A2S1_ARAAE|nr:unnamed protein product [Arabidopsis arenosa]